MIERIKVAQSNDPPLQKITDLINLDSQSNFCIPEDGSLRFGNHLCVTNDPNLKAKILKEAYNMGYTIHPGGTKMYMDLRETF